MRSNRKQIKNMNGKKRHATLVFLHNNATDDNLRMIYIYKKVIIPLGQDIPQIKALHWHIAESRNS